MKHIRILILCIAFALLTGCAPAAQDTAAYAPDESERLVLYTSHKKETRRNQILRPLRRFGAYPRVCV